MNLSTKELKAVAKIRGIKNELLSALTSPKPVKECKKPKKISNRI